MNERQKRFVEFYSANPNAAEAARAAGYSAKTARSQGQRLLTDVDILAAIRNQQDQLAAVRITSMTEVRAFWSDIMLDRDQKTADRLKASELFARSAGAFVHLKAFGAGEDDGVKIALSREDTDVVIYMPEIAPESDFTACDDGN